MFQQLVLAAACGCYGGHGGHGFHGHSQVMYVNARVTGAQIKLQHFFIEMVPETRTITKKVKENGKVREVTEQYTIMAPRTVAKESTHELDKVRGLDHEGRPLDAKTLASRLKTMTAMLATHDPQGIDATYYTVLKRGATVLILPMSAPQKVFPKSAPAAHEGTDFVNAGEKIGLPQKAQGPRGFPPILAGASVDGNGLVHLQQTFNQTMEITAYVEEKNADGNLRKIPVKSTMTTFTLTKQSFDGKWVKGHDLNGKAIDRKALANRLRKHTTVLLSAHGQPVDPYYLQLFREGTVVLVPPAMGHGMYGGYDGDFEVPMPSKEAPKLPLQPKS